MNLDRQTCMTCPVFPNGESTPLDALFSAYGLRLKEAQHNELLDLSEAQFGSTLCWPRLRSSNG
jgi:hypothetical protein